MSYVKSLAKQLGPKGIRVNGVAPGPIWTPLQVSGGATMEKLRNLAEIPRSADQVSRWSSLQFMFSLQHLTQASPTDKCMEPAEVVVSHK